MCEIYQEQYGENTYWCKGVRGWLSFFSLLGKKVPVIFENKYVTKHSFLCCVYVFPESEY